MRARACVCACVWCVCVCVCLWYVCVCLWCACVCVSYSLIELKYFKKIVMEKRASYSPASIPHTHNLIPTNQIIIN